MSDSGEIMRHKKLTVTSLVIMLVGSGFVTPAAAEEANATKDESSGISSSIQILGHDSATLEGQSGSFEIEQTRVSVSSRSSLQREPDLKVDGAELILTAQIASPSSSAAIYSLDTPESASITVVTNDDGEDSILIFTKDDEFLGGMASLEATDAEGTIVPTTFEVDGSTVTQKITAGTEVAYPVTVAAAASTQWYSSAWVLVKSAGYVVNANPTALGRQQTASNVYSLHVRDLKSILGSQSWRVNSNIESQFLCHVFGARANTGVYNMESWQPETSFGILILPWNRCNMIK